MLNEFHLKQDEVAEKVAKSRTAITNSLRLLKLDERVQEMVIEGKLSSGHARAIISIEDKEKQYQEGCMSNNTNNFYGNVSNMQLQQGNVNSTQTQRITSMETIDFDKVSEFVAKIKKYDTLLEDEFGDKATEVIQKITEIETLVQKKENPSKIKMLLIELKNLSVGVAGSLIATGIVEGIKLLLT